MRKNIVKLIASLGLLTVIGLAAYLPAHAALPWGTVYAIPSPGASPICTSFASAPVCIIDLNVALTSVTLSGTPASGDVTVIFQQNGTGGFSYAAAIPTNVVVNTAGSPVPTSIPSAAPTAANNYSAWVLQPVLISGVYDYLLVATYDNVPLFDTFTTTQTSAGSAVAPVTAQLQSTIIVPGMTASHACWCQPATMPATWITGITAACLPQTNAVQCVEVNASGGTITPTPITLNVRIAN